MVLEIQLPAIKLLWISSFACFMFQNNTSLLITVLYSPSQALPTSQMINTSLSALMLCLRLHETLRYQYGQEHRYGKPIFNLGI